MDPSNYTNVTQNEVLFDDDGDSQMIKIGDQLDQSFQSRMDTISNNLRSERG